MASGRKMCMDKTDGPSIHFASFCVEYGNGTICLEPSKPAPYPIAIKELRSWHQKYLLGVECELPQTADVRMTPGAGDGKDGYWGSVEFWMQVDLACEVFKTVFGDPTTSRYHFVGHYDWSQGHAAMKPDSHNAENMLCGTGGKTAKHIKPSSYPYQRNGFNIVYERKALCQDGGCKECADNFMANRRDDGTFIDPHYQSIGVKGLYQVLKERGFNILRPGSNRPKTQEELIAMLQTCPDFETKNLITRAHVTDQMKSHGYTTLLGVKYHAELAWVERKWMHVKRLIRPRLNGKLPRLDELLRQHWPTFTTDDGRKAARHCRESMRAYQAIIDANLDSIREQELKFKGHRRVFDSVVGKYVLQAERVMTAREKVVVIRTEKRRLSQLSLENKLEIVKREDQSTNRKKYRDARPACVKEADKAASIKRKKEWQERKRDPSYKRQITLKESIKGNTQLKKYMDDKRNK